MTTTHEILGEDRRPEGADAPAVEDASFEQRLLKINSEENRMYLRAIYKKIVHMTDEADFYGYLGDENETYQLSTSTTLLERVNSPESFWDEMHSVANSLAESEHSSFKVLQLSNRGSRESLFNLVEFTGMKHNPDDNKVFGRYASQQELFDHLSKVLAPNLKRDGRLDSMEAISDELKLGAEIMCRLGEPKTTNKLLEIINRSLGEEGHGVQIVGIINTESGEQVSLMMLEQRDDRDKLERITLCLDRRGDVIKQFMQARETIINVERNRQNFSEQELVDA